MRLLVETLQQVVVVPTAAVQRGPNGPFVYVVQQDNTAAVRPVTVAQQDETQAVIAGGLQADERVVTTGFARLTDGSPHRGRDCDRPARDRRDRHPSAAGAAKAARARRRRRVPKADAAKAGAAPAPEASRSSTPQ